RDVDAERLRGERLDRQRSGERLDRVAEGTEGDDMVDTAGEKQFLGKVEREDRLHAMEADPVPQLGAGEHPQAARSGLLCLCHTHCIALPITWFKGIIATLVMYCRARSVLDDSPRWEA